MKTTKGIGFFEKYLSIWVALCIVAGIAIGYFVPAFPAILGKAYIPNAGRKFS